MPSLRPVRPATQTAQLTGGDGKVRWLRPHERGDGVCLARLDHVVHAEYSVLQGDKITDFYGWRQMGDAEIVAAHVMDAAGDAEHRLTWCHGRTRWCPRPPVDVLPFGIGEPTVPIRSLLDAVAIEDLV